MPAINALFVDDDQTIKLLAQSVLPSRGVNVLAALNTVEADSLLRRNSVDVIIVDVLMPNEDGLAYCQRLRREGVTVPVMFLSALSDSQTVSKGIASGASAYLVKPCDFYELQKRIEKLVRPPEAEKARDKEPEAPKAGWVSRLFSANA